MNQAPASPATPLAFDIETTGLNPEGYENGQRVRVTCVCLYGQGISKTFLFKGEVEEEDLNLRKEVVMHLDAAPRLCAFNGIRFDIPFLARSWGLPASQAGAWVRKTVDVFEACKLGLGRTFSLDRLLSANGLENKTGSGLHAIHLAKTGQWEELGAYCMHDTRMTHIVSQRAVLPFLAGGRGVVWAHGVFTVV